MCNNCNSCGCNCGGGIFSLLNRIFSRNGGCGCNSCNNSNGGCGCNGGYAVASVYGGSCGCDYCGCGVSPYAGWNGCGWVTAQSTQSGCCNNSDNGCGCGCNNGCGCNG